VTPTRALALAALVAHAAACGVKAAPRPPLRAPAEARDPAAAAVAPAEDCGCAAPSPSFAATTAVGANR
jgi:hypothetical protein